MHVLGLKVAGHDTGAALISNGRVVAIAEERLNRIKHAHGMFPTLSISYCLDAMQITAADVDVVVIDRMVVDKSSGETSVEMFKRQTGDTFTHARIEEVNHHDSHAAAAFFCSPFEESAILVYDGNGEIFTSNTGAVSTETESLYRGRGNTIVPISKTIHAKSARRFPYTSGIGGLYAKLSRDYIGFGQNNEGKMMGLAGYGNDSLLKQFPVEKWMKEYYGQLVCNADIRFETDSLQGMKTRRTPLQHASVAYWGIRLRWIRLRDTLYRRVLSGGEKIVDDPKVFGPITLPRPARDPMKDILPDEYYSSVAYAAQKIFETFAMSLGKKLRTITESDNLCVAGGCGLNIDANRNFLTEVGFKDLFVQPASSDCGIGLGCALWGWHVILEQPRSWVMRHAYLGREYPEKDITDAIADHAGELDVHRADDVAKEAAQCLADGHIVGWFQGGSEYGPRALGHRSILSDARPKNMRDVMNARVKHREMWRPFATSMLAEKLEEWFDLAPSATTSFMLLAGTVHEQKRALVPSIIHVDNTCRMQTLTKADNGIYYDLVKEFETLTGTPLVLNTSFNLGGEPIVETPRDAIDTFLRTDMDYLVVGPWVIRRKAATV